MLQTADGPSCGDGLPTYDVVIPCYNRARTVEQAVESVLRQRHPPCSVILVDDGSRDGSAETIVGLEGRHPCIKAVLLPRNGGASHARNAGLALARAEWIGFLDSDDMWLLGAADALLAQADRADVVVGHFRRAWQSGERGPVECGWVGDDVLPALAATGAIGPSWSIVRRSTARLVRGFDPSFHNCNDWDFYVRVAAAKGRFIRIDEAVALYHVGEANRLSHDTKVSSLNADRVRAHPVFEGLLACGNEDPSAVLA